MKLSTGKTAFTMEFDNGDKGIIYFNPNDRGIQDRIKEFENSVSEKVNKIDLEKYSAKLGDGFSFDVNSIFDLPVEELEKINEKVQVLNKKMELDNAELEMLTSPYGTKEDKLVSKMVVVKAVPVSGKNIPATLHLMIMKSLAKKVFLMRNLHEGMPMPAEL